MDTAPARTARDASGGDGSRLAAWRPLTVALIALLTIPLAPSGHDAAPGLDPKTR